MILWSRIVGIGVLVVGLSLGGAVHAQNKFKASLDPFLDLPSAWEFTPEKLEKKFSIEGKEKSPYFKWLTKDKSRALFQRRPYSNLEIELTIFGGKVPIEEAIIDFKDGKYLGATISIFNRGDGGTISNSDFNERFKLCGKEIGTRLDIRPVRRVAKPKKGMLTSGWIWISGAGMAVLEHNPEAPANVEFLRMRMARRDAEGTYAAAMNARAGATVRLSDLPRNVKRDNDGNVFVKGVPMVDQGQKGYCVVASAQRLFEYYGIPCDQHQLAQIANADPDRGTSTLTINEELGQIDHLFKTRFEALAVGHRNGLVELVDNKYVGDEVEERDYHKMIHKYIDEGIPLLWSLGLGEYAEEPAISPQADGGHMRMIIGYNDKTQRIIFSDSWGAGHEFKTMDAHDSYKATHGLFLLKPTTR